MRLNRKMRDSLPSDFKRSCFLTKGYALGYNLGTGNVPGLARVPFAWKNLDRNVTMELLGAFVGMWLRTSSVPLGGRDDSSIP